MDYEQIMKGTINNIFKRKEDIAKDRMDICRQCPLLKTDVIFGSICNSKLYLGPQGEVSKKPLDGYVRGCGCVLNSKVRVPEASCPAGKW